MELISLKPPCESMFQIRELVWANCSKYPALNPSINVTISMLFVLDDEI